MSKRKNDDEDGKQSSKKRKEVIVPEFFAKFKGREDSKSRDQLRKQLHLFTRHAGVKQVGADYLTTQDAYCLGEKWLRLTWQAFHARDYDDLDLFVQTTWSLQLFLTRTPKVDTWKYLRRIWTRHVMQGQSSSSSMVDDATKFPPSTATLDTIARCTFGVPSWVDAQLAVKHFATQSVQTSFMRRVLTDNLITRLRESESATAAPSYRGRHKKWVAEVWQTMEKSLDNPRILAKCIFALTRMGLCAREILTDDPQKTAILLKALGVFVDVISTFSARDRNEMSSMPPTMNGDQYSSTLAFLLVYLFVGFNGTSFATKLQEQGWNLFRVTDVVNNVVYAMTNPKQEVSQEVKNPVPLVEGLMHDLLAANNPSKQETMETLAAATGIMIFVAYLNLFSAKYVEAGFEILLRDNRRESPQVFIPAYNVANPEQNYFLPESDDLLSAGASNLVQVETKAEEEEEEEEFDGRVEHAGCEVADEEEDGGIVAELSGKEEKQEDMPPLERGSANPGLPKSPTKVIVIASDDDESPEIKAKVIPANSAADRKLEQVIEISDDDEEEEPAPVGEQKQGVNLEREEDEMTEIQEDALPPPDAEDKSIKAKVIPAHDSPMESKEDADLTQMLRDNMENLLFPTLFSVGGINVKVIPAHDGPMEPDDPNDDDDMEISKALDHIMLPNLPVETKARPAAIGGQRSEWETLDTLAQKLDRSFRAGGGSSSSSNNKASEAKSPFQESAYHLSLGLLLLIRQRIMDNRATMNDTETSILLSLLVLLVRQIQKKPETYIEFSGQKVETVQWMDIPDVPLNPMAPNLLKVLDLFMATIRNESQTLIKNPDERCPVLSLLRLADAPEKSNAAFRAPYLQCFDGTSGTSSGFSLQQLQNDLGLWLGHKTARLTANVKQSMHPLAKFVISVLPPEENKELQVPDEKKPGLVNAAIHLRKKLSAEQLQVLWEADVMPQAQDVVAADMWLKLFTGEKQPNEAQLSTPQALKLAIVCLLFVQRAAAA